MSSSCKVGNWQELMLPWPGSTLKSPSPQDQIMTTCFSVEKIPVSNQGGFHLLSPPSPWIVSLWFPNSRLLPDQSLSWHLCFVSGLLFPSHSLWTCRNTIPYSPTPLNPFHPYPQYQNSLLWFALGNLLTFLRTTFQLTYLPRMKQIEILHKFQISVFYWKV